MAKIFKLEKPNLSAIDTKELFSLALDKVNVGRLMHQTSFPEYIYWNKLKYKKLAKEFSPEKIWAILRFARKIQSTQSVIKAENNKNFTWFSLPGLEEFFHQMDLNMGGHLFAGVKEFDEKQRFKFIARGIQEEAIATSQLEGANTTRKLAKQFLLEGRKPKTEAEHMVLNSYKTMQVIEKEYKNKKISLESLFELHAMIVKNTVSSKEQGHFRTDKDEIVVRDYKYIYHIPPKVKFLKKEMDRLIKFANDQLGEPFIHPIIKAIMLHFWLAYLHPFTDGNGRLARLFFYWYLLRKGYWAFAYLPISSIIKRSPAQYRSAYVYSEQDDLDLTYFIDYNIRKIKLAAESFEKYAQEKSMENKIMNNFAKTEYKLNNRQIQLLQYYYNNKEEYTTPKMHMNLYQISKRTSSRDLQELKVAGFIAPKTVKRNTYYYATKKIEKLFKGI